jgi:hypothetical protein
MAETTTRSKPVMTIPWEPSGNDRRSTAFADRTDARELRRVRRLSEAKRAAAQLTRASRRQEAASANARALF